MRPSRAAARRSLRKVRNLCVELGLVTWFTKPLWKATEWKVAKVEPAPKKDGVTKDAKGEKQPDK